MQAIETSVRNPAGVAAAVALLVMLGGLALNRLPVQMIPDIQRPQLTVQTGWRAAAPEEMEAVIIEPQERELRFITGLEEMTTNIQRGFGQITLTFALGTDMQQATLDVISALNRIGNLPQDAFEPRIEGGAGQSGAFTASLLLVPMEGNPSRDMAEYQDFIEEVIEPRLRALPGVARVGLEGRRPRELEIRFDPNRAAALGVTVGEIVAAAARSNDISGGFADVGRRQYTVRVAGRLEPEELGQLVVGWRDDSPVYLGDVATVRERLTDRFGFTLRSGVPSFYISIGRQYGANTVELLDALNIALDELNSGPLVEQQVQLELSFDASVHIRRAIAFVQGNLALGAMLAVFVLWLFLRRWRETAVIAGVIPLSVISAIIALHLCNLSLNVISLAGLAFAVGLVLDAAIVVQENIVRLRQDGMSASAAAIEGAKQVSPALLASTVTTVAVFLPILGMEGIGGQVFFDLAITLSVAVVASLCIAITVLPTLAAHLGSRELSHEQDDAMAPWWDRVTAFSMRLTATPARRAAWVGTLTAASIVLTVSLIPKADLMPNARADSFFVNFVMPAGGNVETLENEVAAEIVRRFDPYMRGEKQPNSATTTSSPSVRRFPEWRCTRRIRATSTRRCGCCRRNCWSAFRTRAPS